MNDNENCKIVAVAIVTAILHAPTFAGTPCPPTDFAAEGGTTSAPNGTDCPTPNAGTIYTTSFDAAENPISEGGKWVNGKAVGVNWNDVQSDNGNAYAADFIGQGSRYNDPIAHLSSSFMTFAADQYAEATVSRVAGYRNPTDKHEIELLLRFEITANSARGYEVLWGQDGEIYVVRWNGPLGSYKSLGGIPDPGPGPAVDGDVLRAEITGSVIKVYLNGSLVFTAPSDSTFSSGQPGIGFWPTAGSTLASYGWKDFKAGNL